jgi:predicted nucleic acid-binding protein
MVLVDSVRIVHLRRTRVRQSEKPVMLLSDLRGLPRAHVASDAEAMHLIEVRKLWERALAWVDVHLLAAALPPNCRFWTLDKRLDSAASELALS